MEILQGMKDKNEYKLFQKQLQKWETDIIQIDAQVSVRAMFYIQEYAPSHSMMLADALIAATAVRNGDTLLTGNHRHYSFIPNIEIDRFDI